MILGHELGRPLFELRPDLFPQGFLTETELELWGRFFEQRSRMIDGYD